ncbi:MAG: 3-beta hydroxysteroid dehydrogenase/isomerase family protein [Verrucomicrobiales bacterium]|nr:3-beta hydroxysteroid dehydrogenase/isomerase family protein [Verrucomicrobiales bacterium]
MERRINHVLITGVTGFLGGHLAARLRGMGVRVRGVGRDAARGEVLRERLGVDFVRMDLGTPEEDEDAARLCGNVDTVFHAGALSSPWGKKSDFEKANVQATRRVIRAARRAGVERLVHVSTPSLYFRHGGGTNVREDAPLPPPVNDYVRTKRLAEGLVREAGSDGWETVTIRPRALIGAGDPSILPRLIRALEKGRLPVIGNGDNLTDLTCVENAVDALILAATVSGERVAGKVYNITNGEPVKLWEILARMAGMLDLPPPGRHVPARLVQGVAGILEGWGRLRGKEPSLTRYGVGVLSETQTLDISAARRDLGYAPELTVSLGLDRFVSWWRSGAPYPFWTAPDGGAGT